LSANYNNLPLRIPQSQAFLPQCIPNKFAPWVFILFCLFAGSVFAQNTIIIPQPTAFLKSVGSFQLSVNTVIGLNDNALLPQANYLQNELRKLNNLAIAVDPVEQKATIDFRLVSDAKPAGAYTLKIEPARITLTASTNEGIFYGIVSLLQLIRQQPVAYTIDLPSAEVTDAPRYPWRGFMLDESRHFFGKKKVEQLLDWMAFYKLNKFHWHLTDANGWRIQIKKYPLLTTVGGIGNHSDTLAEAKYYTQEEITEVVAYAQERFITVIPEIDMPGHATAANKAYPGYSGGSVNKYPNFTFDPANEKTYQFLADILKETSTLFPAHMIHLGGDEVALGMQAWASRPAITDMLLKNKFTALADLEHYFFRRMADTVINLGDKVLCWDEATDSNLPADKTIIFWWRQNIPSQLRLALQKKYQIVLCPRLPLYFDFVQDKSNVSGRKWIGQFNSTSDVYNFPDKQIPPDEMQSPQILGVQANLWTELVGTEKRLDYMLFPRIAALAEAAWTDSAAKNEVSFNERLKGNFALYDKEGIYYYNPFDPASHPEAIDFAPNLIKKPVLKKDRKHHLTNHGAGARRHKKGSTSSKHSEVGRNSKSRKRR
jgi:hexosaminidase